MSYSVKKTDKQLLKLFEWTSICEKNYKLTLLIYMREWICEFYWEE